MIQKNFESLGWAFAFLRHANILANITFWYETKKVSFFMFSSLSLSLLLCCVKVEQAKEYEGDPTTHGVDRERREREREKRERVGREEMRGGAGWGVLGGQEEGLC